MTKAINLKHAWKEKHNKLNNIGQILIMHHYSFLSLNFSNNQFPISMGYNKLGKHIRIYIYIYIYIYN